MQILMERWRKTVRQMEKEAEEAEIKKLLPDEPDDQDELDEEKEDYPSWKERRRLKKLGKPEDASWVHSADQMLALGRGVVRQDELKVNCNDGNPYHGEDGKFVDPDKEKGSYSMREPTSDSPEDCTWGKASRKSSNRSRQAVKQDCGRGAKYRCKDGSEKWEETLVREDLSQQDAAYIRGILQQELKAILTKYMQASGCSFHQLVRAMQAWSNAQKAQDKK